MSEPERLKELLALMEQKPFDEQRASCLLEGIKDIDQTIPAADIADLMYDTTLLIEAVDSCNPDAVRFLFEHGADPNYINEDYDCPLSDLQFGYDDPEDDQDRYKTAKLFLEYGADPNLMVEGETVFDAVTYSVYDDFGELDFPYLVEFYKLLVLYGGGGFGYEKPELSEPVDLNRADEYKVRFRFLEDGHHIEGHLLDPDGKDIGLL